MPEPDSPREAPLVEPRVVRFLKERPRLVKGDIREDFLEQLEMNMRDRRRPDNAAERAVKRVFQEAGETVAPVTKTKMRDRMETANETVLENL